MERQNRYQQRELDESPRGENAYGQENTQRGQRLNRDDSGMASRRNQ